MCTQTNTSRPSQDGLRARIAASGFGAVSDVEHTDCQGDGVGNGPRLRWPGVRMLQATMSRERKTNSETVVATTPYRTTSPRAAPQDSLAVPPATSVFRVPPGRYLPALGATI